MNTITLPMLKDACKEQRAIFRKEWPKGCEVTLANVQRAQELGLDLTWGGEEWFTAAARKLYDESRAAAWLVAYEQSVAERAAS